MVYNNRQNGAHNHFHGPVTDLDFNIYTASHCTPVKRTVALVCLVGLGVLLELILNLLRKLEAFFIEGRPKLGRNNQRGDVEQLI